MQVADRIAQRFRTEGFEVEGRAVVLTASLGVAACADQETLFFDTLVSQAEIALEQAAGRGEGTAQLFRRERFVADPDGPQGGGDPVDSDSA